MRTTHLYRYEFDASVFLPWALASGQWNAERELEPLRVTPLGNLLDAHINAGIELRIVPSLWPLHDIAISDQWDFSIVRMANAKLRDEPFTS